MVRLVTDVVQTCGVCPSQWEARTLSGLNVYVRYRWGVLTVDVDGSEVECVVAGDHLDGYMAWERVEQLTILRSV